MKNIKIIIAAHKKYQMPKDKFYLPLHVGAEGKEEIGYRKDNEGKNISGKNPYFCELTGIYWAWKNLDADYIGLVHYRRYFTMAKKVPKEESKKFDIVLSENEASKILEKVDVILPKKRKYYIENLYSHYKHTMYVEPLDETEKIIKEKYPEYINEFEKLHKRTSAHMFNMFVMRKDLLDSYCGWMFPILDVVDHELDYSQMSPFEARAVGRLSERLLEVWLIHNRMSFVETPVLNTEKTNWIVKGGSFLAASLFGKKYEKSF